MEILNLEWFAVIVSRVPSILSTGRNRRAYLSETILISYHINLGINAISIVTSYILQVRTNVGDFLTPAKLWSGFTSSHIYLKIRYIFFTERLYYLCLNRNIIYVYGSNWQRPVIAFIGIITNYFILHVCCNTHITFTLWRESPIIRFFQTIQWSLCAQLIYQSSCKVQPVNI